MNALFLFAFATIALILSVFFFPILIKLLHRWEVLDHPRDHKIHSAYTPSMGGICILLAVAFTLLIALPFSEWVRHKFFFIAFAIIFFTGLRDDILNLTPWQKLLGQILPIALVVVLGGMKISSFYGLHAAPLSDPWSWVITIFVIVALTNSYNLIDGIDGLAGVVSALVFFVLGAWFWAVGNFTFATLSFIFFGSILGFLYYNWQPSKIFMGDTGTLPIGFALSVLLVAFLESNQALDHTNLFRVRASVGAALSVMVIPIFDTIRVVILRLLNGQSPFKADRNHLHHQLLRIGFSHAQAALALGAVNAAFIALAWFGRNWSDPLLLAVVIAGCFGLSFILYQVEKRNARKN